MSCIKSIALSEPLVDVVEADAVTTNAMPILVSPMIMSAHHCAIADTILTLCVCVCVV